MLNIVGVPELVTGNSRELAATAARIGRDAEERRALSERIVAGREALFEREEPVRAFEAFLGSVRGSAAA
jgi:hypothetical protein